MAEEEREHKGFGKKVWEIFQSVGASAGLLALQHAVTETLTAAGKKTGEKMGEHISKRTHVFLGLDIEEAKENVEDEIYYGAAVNDLEDNEADEINAFEARLRSEDATKAEAFVLFLAKKIKKFEWEEKRRESPPKNQQGPRIETVCMNITDGINQGVKFLRALLRQRGNDDQETFEKRVAFLEGKNVFSLIQEKKPTPAAETAKRLFGWGKDRVDEARTENVEDFNSTGKKFADWAKNFRDRQ